MTPSVRDPAPDEVLARPDAPCGTGVLVLAGSSGAVERQRVTVLASRGALALSIQWFGGPGQQPEPFEVPIETFIAALDRLSLECDRLAILGASFGAEAALLTASHDVRVEAVVACAPSSVVWAGVDSSAGGAGRMTSHWTVSGTLVPFVPFVPFVPYVPSVGDGEPDHGPPAYRSHYERSLAAHPDEARRAAIPAERIVGDVVLVAGEDDRVWPSADFARALARRRAQHGLDTTLVVHPEAGHRVVLPGEARVRRGQAMARGGSDESDAALGTAAWPHVMRALRLR